MRPVKIITDSCSDLSQELLEKYNIDFAKHNIIRKEEVTSIELNLTTGQFKDLYSAMRNHDRIYITQPTIQEFQNIFTKHLDKGFDVVYIGCSEMYSGAIKTAEVIARQLRKKYAEAQLFCIDSGKTSLGEGIIVIEAAKLASEGLSAEDINEHIKTIKNRVNQFIAGPGLPLLKNQGIQIEKSFKSFNRSGKKPVYAANAEGLFNLIKITKKKDNKLEKLIALMKDAIIDGANQTLFLIHSDCSDEEITSLRKLAQKELPCKKIETLYMGAVTGTIFGPDAIGLVAFGKSA